MDAWQLCRPKAVSTVLNQCNGKEWKLPGESGSQSLKAAASALVAARTLLAFGVRRNPAIGFSPECQY